MIRVRGFIFSDILSKGITASFIPLFAFYMGPSDLASFGSWFLVFTTVSLFSSFGSPSFFSKKIIDNEDVKEELFFFFLLATITLSIFTLICFSLKIDYTPFLCSYFFVFFQLRLAVLRVNNNLSTYAKLNLAFSFSCSIFPLVAYLYFDDWLARIYLYIFITILFGGNAIWSIIPFRHFYIRDKKFKSFSINLIKFGLPLSLSGVIFSLRTLFDFLALEIKESDNLAASYFLTFQLISVVLLFGAILNRTLQPTVFKLIRDGEQYITTLHGFSAKILAAIIPMLAFGWGFSLFYAEYESLNLFFVPMTIGAVVYIIAQLYSNVLLYNQRSSVLLWCSVWASLLHVLSSTTLIVFNLGDLLGLSSMFSSFFYLLYVFQLKKKFRNVEA